MHALVYEPLDYYRHRISVIQEFDEIKGQVIQEVIISKR
jgi:hypothetical protein